MGFWLPLGAGPQAAGSLESGGLAWRNLSASARLALASPVYVTEALSPRTSHLTLQMRATWRERPSIEAGVESGVSLRRILVDGEEALRDWTPAVGTGVGLGWPVPGGWRVTVSGSALAALPPAVLVTSLGSSARAGSSQDNPEDRAGRAEAWRRGQAALGPLPEPLREVYALFIEGHTVTEIAEILDIPRGTVASRLRKAQMEVRRLLDPNRVQRPGGSLTMLAPGSGR